MFPTLDDTLPPFSSLTTDEDREKKAETSYPGTFHVVVNPNSFIHLPEYSDEAREPSVPRSSSLRRGSLAVSTISSIGRDMRRDSTDFIAEDDTTVIIHRFEDTSRRGTFSGKAPESPLLSKEALKTESPIEDIDMVSEQDSTSVSNEGPENETSQLVKHFRDRVVKQVMQFTCDPETTSSSEILSPGAEIFEQTAAFAPPVRHRRIMTYRPQTKSLTRVAFQCHDGCSCAKQITSRRCDKS